QDRKELQEILSQRDQKINESIKKLHGLTAGSEWDDWFGFSIQDIRDMEKNHPELYEELFDPFLARAKRMGLSNDRSLDLSNPNDRLALSRLNSERDKRIHDSLYQIRGIVGSEMDSATTAGVSQLLARCLTTDIEAAAADAHNNGWKLSKDADLRNPENPFIGWGKKRVRVNAEIKAVTNKEEMIAILAKQAGVSEETIAKQLTEEKFAAIKNAKEGKDIVHPLYKFFHELKDQPLVIAKNALPLMVLTLYMTDFRGNETKTKEGLEKVLANLMNGSDQKGIQDLRKFQHLAFQALVLGQGERGYENEVPETEPTGRMRKLPPNPDFQSLGLLDDDVQALDEYTIVPAAKWLADRAKEIPSTNDITRSEGDISRMLNDNTSVPGKPGGIDFRVMNIIVQPMGNFSKLNYALPKIANAQNINIEQEIIQIKKMVDSGIIPSGNRIKELLAACSLRDQMDIRSDDIHACLTEIFNLEENNLVESDPELKETLVILTSSTL
ncbi:MAG: hypothetical protein MUF05_07745, partial [Candidatus Omnitrophica bacterium]|nr:hypothetical protein [Candidatus Omnitrophota bacterium]